MKKPPAGSSPAARAKASASSAADLRPRGCTNFKLRQLSRVVTQDYDTELAASGVKITQYSLLNHVQSMGPIRPVDLAQRMRMDSSTLSRNLRPMLTAGWLELVEGDDARSHRVALTEAGEAKRLEARKHWRIAQERLNRTLGTERVLALHALIDDALEALSPLPADQP